MKKLLWPEGSLLTQQHFQYAANESARNCRDNIRLLQRDLWGFIEYQTELDESFTLKSATVRLPSGDIIDVHSPLSVALPGNETAEIFLTLPLNHRVSSLAGYRDDGCQSRWKACYEDYPDEYDSTRLQELVFAEDNWSLSL